MDVADFLQFQSAFKGNRVIKASAKEEPVVVVDYQVDLWMAPQEGVSYPGSDCIKNGYGP